MKRFLMILIAMAMSSQVALAGDKEEKDKVFDEKELKRCDEAVAAFLENDEKMDRFFKKSYAYAVYDNVAKGAKGAKGRGRVTSKILSESISSVIADMLEKHAAELEGQAKTVRGASRG